MPSIRGRLGRERAHPEREPQYFAIDPNGLTQVFSSPRWLRDAGVTSWLLVGIALLLVGVISLLAMTQVIVLPVLTASVIAAVAGQPVAALARRGVPRGLGTLIVLIAIMLVGGAIAYIVLAGVADESSGISEQLNGAVDEIESGLTGLGVGSSEASDAGATLADGASVSVGTLLSGVLGGVARLSSLVFFLAMTLLSLIFLLKDGPTIRAWTERHMGVPPADAHSVTQRILGSLRGYFLGVTIVAVFSAVLVGGGALLLGIPLAGTIAVVTLLGGYVPYLGAWTAAAFSVLVALGGSGPEAAAGMVVIQLISNGPLQQMVQPIAYGAALGIHPLAVLIVTIAGGAMFGTVGLILAAPLTSAAVRIAADIGRSRQQELEAKSAAEPPPAAAAAPT